MFENILGQEQAKLQVQRWHDKKRWPNAAILFGPSKTGKWLLAQNIAQMINCHGQKTVVCMCASCKKIRQRCHPDVYFIEPNEKGNILIDQIRELGENLSFVASEGSRKVALIKDAHAMLPQAANALLKILEEPEGGTTIVLTTNKPDSVLDTIKSRSSLVRFSFLKDDHISQLLGRDGINQDPITIQLLGGSYSLEGSQDGLLVFKKFWEGQEILSLDEQMTSALRNELIYIAGCLVYMYKNNLAEFNKIKVLRLNGEKVNSIISVVEQALDLYDSGVRPFLVAKLFESQTRGILDG